MQSLRELETFVAIAEEGSLTGAARRLGRSLQAVSRGLQTLEGEMGATLVLRTTRTSRLSDAGERFYGRVKAILADLEIAQTELAEDARRLTGRLRVNVPTLEYEGGVAVRKQAQFRSYKSTAESLADYADLIGKDPRYASALGHGDDVLGYAKALVEGGYATDPSYAGKVAAIANSSVMRQALDALKKSVGVPNL